ncbi:Transmembrane protein 41A [Mortierella sp. GBA30]|nr:Transmembrane protein 41A [Mortierella sp. GBA30]
MTTFVATANAASAATVAALGRFHSSTKGESLRSTTTGRQRSSSFTLRNNGASATNSNTARASLRSSYPSQSPVTTDSAPLMSSLSSSSSRGLSKGQYHLDSIAHRDLSAPSSPSDYSGLEVESTVASTLSSHRAHQLGLLGQGFDRKNLVPSATDHSYSTNSHNSNNNNNNKNSNSNSTNNSNANNAGDLHHYQTQENTSTVCTGRSRSNTLTNTGTSAAEVAVASINSQLDHVMRPRRPSLVIGSSGSFSAQPSIVLPAHAPATKTSTAASHSYYPPPSLLPQYQEVEESKTNGADNVNSPESLPNNSPWGKLRLGFLPRILILIGLFGLSLGGLYLLAQVLPPLSLPKSIDDVKVDSAILQEFATATFEGWIRTFWVFSVVYMWKQCFGIPGSAFLNILAGALYGPWFGTVLTSLLTTLGSVLAYFMSFFLMEPILNRYASSRLDQMRLQIQKKTSRSAKSSKSFNSSTATSTAVQTSISGPSASASCDTVSSDGPSSTSSTASVQRGAALRTRSSSFTARRTGEIQRDLSSSSSPYTYSHYVVDGASSAPISARPHDEIETQESEGLLSEERNNAEKPIVIHDEESVVAGDKDVENEDENESEGTSLFMQLLLIRLFPLTPYWFINLASPLVGVPVVPFMTSMFLGCMPYNYICAQAGAILGEIHELRDIYQQPWILFQVVLVLVLSTAAVWVSKRSKKRQMEKDQQLHNKSRSSEDEMEDEDETTYHLLGHSEEAENHHRQDRRDRQDAQDGIDDVPMSPMGQPNGLTPGANKRDSAVIDMREYRY